MKSSLLLLALLTSVVQAQVATAPDGASAVGSPPVGENRVSGCGTRNCFEIRIEPYCFGTNLRGYSNDIQMNSTDNLSVKLNIGGPSGDNLQAIFPPRLTYNPNGIRPICTAKPGQNMGQSGARDFICPLNINGTNSSVTYRIADWRGSTNPACFAQGGSHGPTYCNYAARPLSASKLSSSDPGDSQITCLYSFDNNYQLKNEVVCQFPSLMADESSSIKLKVNGTDFTSAEISAFTNKISIKVPLANLPFVSGQSQLSQGRRVIPKAGDSLPSSIVEFAQINPNNSLRPLEKPDSGYQLPDRVTNFESVNYNMSYSIIAKFPGAQGFCGGYYSPLMLFFEKEYPQFTGVSLFPLYGVKEGGRVNWPEAGSKGYFLASLNGEEKEITKASQLFGQDGLHENGFESLKRHDSDKNGIINKKDSIWKSLRLWKDENSNGISEQEELHKLSSKGVVSISLNYHSRDQLKVEQRARGREKSKFSYLKDGKVLEAEVIDIWLAPID